MKMILIVGSGPGKWADLGEFWDLRPGKHDVCCLNAVGLTFPCPFRYWASWHTDLLVEWAKSRPGPELWSSQEGPGVNVGMAKITRGSSAMVAVQLALHTWRHDRIVLAGIPLDNGYGHYVEYWKPLVETHGHMIRSMSGNTADLFGQPDDDFVHGAAIMPPHESTTAP